MQLFSCMLIIITCDGQGKSFTKSGLTAQQLRIEETEQGMQIHQVVLHRRTGRRYSKIGVQLSDAFGPSRRGVLDRLCLIQNHTMPMHFFQVLDIVDQQAIADDNDIECPYFYQHFLPLLGHVRVRQHLQ